MIWCVEDDDSIRDIEVYALQSTGLEARGFADGGSFWAALEQEKPALVVLDVMLPGVSGIDLLRRMKASPALREIPVVMATAKGAEYDRIQGLDLGADYYLTKPFGVMELVSCVKAVLRRCGQSAEQARTLSSGGLCVHLDERTVTADGERIALTYIEECLEFFQKLEKDIDSYPDFHGKGVLWVHLMPYYQETLKGYFNYQEKYYLKACEMNLDYMEELDTAHPLNALARKMLNNLYNGSL